MDINLARTFLVIDETGSFVKAAETLFVTQSTISARVRQLEDLLGQQLFVRSKSGATTTTAGTRFRPFAKRLIQTWQQAHQEIGLPDDIQSRISIGVQDDLWERLIPQWIIWMRSTIPNCAISVETGSSDGLTRRLTDGYLDLIVTSSPQRRPSVVIHKIIDETLLLVSSSITDGSGEEKPYIFVDWGTEFRMEHAAAFPQRTSNILSVNNQDIAISLMRTSGGSAYLSASAVQHLIQSEPFQITPDAPQFSIPIFIAHTDNDNDIHIRTAIDGLKMTSKNLAIRSTKSIANIEA